MRKKPDVGQNVIDNMNNLIVCAISETDCTSRAEIAKWILTTKAPWYTQTPEGEYLHWVAFGGQE